MLLPAATITGVPTTAGLMIVGPMTEAICPMVGPTKDSPPAHTAGATGEPWPPAIAVPHGDVPRPALGTPTPTPPPKAGNGGTSCALAAWGRPTSTPQRANTASS